MRPRRVGWVPATTITCDGCSGRRTDQFWDGRPVECHAAGLVLTLIKTEWRVFVAHQGNVGEDAVEPAADAKKQIEKGAGVPPGDQQEETGDDDEQVQH